MFLVLEEISKTWLYLTAQPEVVLRGGGRGGGVNAQFSIG